MKKPWPKLSYNEWNDTYQTLHRYLQIVGKLRIYKAPWINHSWHATYYVTSRGLTTSAIPLEDRNLTVEFDFVDHEVIFNDSLGKSHKIPLRNESVANFFQEFLDALEIMDVTGYVDDHPVECLDNIRFPDDHDRKTYNPDHANQFFQVLVRVNNVFQKFRSEFLGKSSPVHLFWGSFDLVVTRFSGRKAPEFSGIAPYVSPLIMKEAYSHEVSSCGFWPGNEKYPHIVFYSYAYPEPDGYKKAIVQPVSAFYNKDMGEFMLHYEDVLKSDDPDEVLMSFLESTYLAASELGNWDSKEFEGSPYLHQLSEKYENRI